MYACFSQIWLLKNLNFRSVNTEGIVLSSLISEVSNKSGSNTIIIERLYLLSFLSLSTCVGVWGRDVATWGWVNKFL